jgi:hypothetical protein
MQQWRLAAGLFPIRCILLAWLGYGAEARRPACHHKPERHSVAADLLSRQARFADRCGQNPMWLICGTSTIGIWSGNLHAHPGLSSALVAGMGFVSNYS